MSNPNLLVASALRRLALPLAAASALITGCASMDVHKAAVEKTDTMRAGPEQKPFRAITGFSNGLRCMDYLFIDYGVRDLSMLVEELLDSTKKVNAGTRDMLITAVSDMTRRSRAIRVNAFGKDATNVISYLASAQRQNAYDLVPPYDIKGSVSQLDENVIRNQKDVGIGFSPFINLGIAGDAASSVMGVDLSVLTTEDMSIIPGVTSRNSVVIMKSGRGVDGDAAYHKFGVSYSMTLSKSEGQAQALRGLIELAAIELMGKLTKTPYWRCLGTDSAKSEEVKLEIADWYYAMAATRVELIAYFQNQMRRRGFYDGPIDGEFNPAIDEAIANYREAIGMSKKALLDEELLTRYLDTDQNKVPRPEKPSRWAAPAPDGAAAAAPAVAGGDALRLALATTDRRTTFAQGESFDLTVQPSSDAHVYCYLQDENAKITRFYPNRFARDSLVSAAGPLSLPGRMRFQLAMNTKGAKETFACFATRRDVLSDLPAQVAGTDFEPIAATSMDQVRLAFAGVTRGAMAQETLHVQAP
jgi:Domain of unknown function (DUF4384)